MIITIDGPAGTGKSSVARDLASELGLEFLDTGAMYRAATALALDSGVPMDDEFAVARLVRRADMGFDWSHDPPVLRAEGRDMTSRVRDADVNANVSLIAALPEVRRVLVAAQRRIGEAHPALVTEGRDQGSVVFHDAGVKFFLDASPRVRAERRCEQLIAMGRAEEADVDTVERQRLSRDEIDSSREVGPLRCPDDAIRVDTSELDQRGVVEVLITHVRAALPETPAVLVAAS